MQKTFNFKMVVVVLIALFTITSCGKETPVVEPPVPNDTTKVLETLQVDMLRATTLYIGDNKGEFPGKHLYRFQFATNGAVAIDETVGVSYKNQGVMYQFMLSSDAPADALKPVLKLGTYKIDDAMQPMSIVKDINYTQLRPFTTTSFGTAKTFKSGEMTVEADKITFKGIDNAGDSIKIAYSGSYTAQSIKDTTTKAFLYNYEHMFATNIELSYSDTDANDSIRFDNYGPYLNPETSDVLLNMFKKTGEHQTQLEYILPKDRTEMLPGNYMVSGEKDKVPMTMMQSVGNWYSKQDGLWYIQPTDIVFYKKGNEKEDNVIASYYLMSGSSVVTETGLSFTGISYYGSFVKVTYKGAMLLHKQY